MIYSESDFASSNLMAFKKSRGSCKKSWSPHEDSILQDLVKVYGTSSWTKIAEGLSTRTGKQCRERYHNHLQPNIRKGDWTEEEDRIIVEQQLKLGNQWAKITKMLPGRTDNAVKNRWHAAMRSQGRPTYDTKAPSRKQGRSHPSVPTLALTEAGVSSAGVARAELDSDDYVNLFGGNDTDSESQSSNGPHHTKHFHSNSARTEPPTGVGANTARMMDDMDARMDNDNDFENTDNDDNGDASRSGEGYSTFSPRLSDFLCFPLSSSSTNNAFLSGSSDSCLGMNSTPPDLLAADGSPREVAAWLSASPRARGPSLQGDAFAVFGAYITSPGRVLSSTKTADMSPRTSPSPSPSSSSSGDAFKRCSTRHATRHASDPGMTAAATRHKHFTFEGHPASSVGKRDADLFANLRMGSASYGSSVTLTSKECSMSAAFPTEDKVDMQGTHFAIAAMSHTGDLSELSAASEDSQLEFDHTRATEQLSDGTDDEDSTDFDFLGFGRLEVSPRWQLSPRSSGDVKRRRADSTPVHMRGERGSGSCGKDNVFFNGAADEEESDIEVDVNLDSTMGMYIGVENAGSSAQLNWKGLDIFDNSCAYDASEMFL